MVPERFKDFISTPKTNGYRSIHTTVIGPEKQRVEVQIRTQEMHDVAERGVAAHWRYREHVDDTDRTAERAYEWLRDMVDLLERGDSAEELLENSRLNMYQDQVFCFTPKGEPDLAAARRDADRFRLCGAHRSRQHRRGREGEWRPCAAAHPAAKWRPGRDHLAPRTRRRRRCGSSSWSPGGRAPKSAASCAMPSATSMSSFGRKILEKVFADARRELTDKAIDEVAKKLASGQGR